MELLLKRVAKRATYTIGKLYEVKDGVEHYICDTIEDADRGLTSQMSVEEIKTKKVYGETCIPTGTYEITLGVKSGKFSNFAKYPLYKKWDGFLPRLVNVKGFEGILIHVGNTAKHSHGCILPGKNTVVGGVTQSTAYFTKLMEEFFIPAKNRGEKLTIKIV